MSTLRKTPFDRSRVDETTGLRKVFLRMGSPHPPLTRPGPDDDDVEWPENNEERKQARRSDLRLFGQAIRAKSQWFIKIMQQKGLAEKWVAESKIEDGADLQDLILELKHEARRIYLLDHTIRLDSTRLHERHIDWDTIRAEVTASKLYLRSSKFATDEPDLYESVGTYTVDDAVPAVLHNEVVKELDALAALIPKDYHPGTGGKVQDLIHPSLYPYEAAVTPLLPTSKLPPMTKGRFITSMSAKSELGQAEVEFDSAFAWIPSIIQVSDTGHATIDGYINGLGTREQFPTLYRLIEEVFEFVMPLLEKTCTFKFEHSPYNSSYHRWGQRKEFLEMFEDGADGPAWAALKEKQTAEKMNELKAKADVKAQRTAEKIAERALFEKSEADLSLSSSKSPWAGQRLKVVIKAANYILLPGQEYTGTWHIEGMPHERIVASAIYYYDRDTNIRDAGLYLRRRRDGDDDFPQESHRYHDFHAEIDGVGIHNNPSDYGSDHGMGFPLPAYINVGVVPTMKEGGAHGTGRIVTFPNWLQHRVVRVANDSQASGPALRKILCFFLVDDDYLDPDFDPSDQIGFYYDGIEDMNVLSTDDVPSQARACNLPTVAFLLRVAFRQYANRHVPDELIDLVLDGLGGPGQLTRQEAEKQRRAFIEDRKVNAESALEVWDNEEWSLCEH